MSIDLNTIKNRKTIKKEKRTFKCPRIKTKNYDFPIYLVPIAIVVIPIDKIKSAIDNKLSVWDETKAVKVIEKTLAKEMEYNEEDNSYVYYGNGYRIYDYAKCAPFGLKRFASSNKYEIEHYLIDNYNIDGYTKEIEREYCDWLYVIFKKEG